MKNHRLKISIALLGIIFVSMTTFVLMSKAASSAQSRNPYDDPSLGVNDVIELYHKNMNEAFNEYIKKMMKGSPDDKNGKAYHVLDGNKEGEPLTAAECLSPKYSANYSTFCVSVNLLGADSDFCSVPQTADDMIQFCKLDKGALARKGYLNFSSAIAKRTQQVFDTEKEKADWKNMSIGERASQGWSSITAATKLISRQTIIADEMRFAKEALDQTLSAYDQLKVVWPLHQKYVGIYHSLEQYRDKLVDVRHQTDAYPKRFIDVTTTACK